METIQNYLDNLFANLPKTKEILHIKQELLYSMEEKYLELKHDGKSENEAIGIVISEFGNIDELIDELGIKVEDTPPAAPTVSKDEAEDFLFIKKKSGKWIGLGVFFCILGPAILILLIGLTGSTASSLGITLGLIILLSLITVAVGLFVYSSNKLEPYQYLENGVFHLPTQLKMEIQQRKKDYLPTLTISTIIGIGLCIISPITVIAASSLGEKVTIYGVVALLLLIATAIYILIYSSTQKEGYNILLQEEEFDVKVKEEDRVIGVVASIVWPVALCIFLVSGLVYGSWHINWVIFPITGILFGAFCGVYNNLKKPS